MDDKAGRRDGAQGNRRRQTWVRRDKSGVRRDKSGRYGRKVWKSFQTHKNTLLTGILLLSLVVLLVGIVSQLQPPTPNTVPNGQTTIEYSAFVKQVKDGNMLAASVRGNEVTGLLAQPLQSGTTTTTSTTTHPGITSDEYDAWMRYIGNTSAGWSTSASASSTTLTPDRVVFTRISAGGDAELMPLLLSQHVVVSAQAPNQPAAWTVWVWRLAPFIFLLIFFLAVMASRNGNRSMRSLDDRITQIGKSRARRFTRTKEASTPTTQTKRPVSSVTSGPLAKTGQLQRNPQQNSQPGVTFADVAGIDEVRIELEEIVQFLRSPEQFHRLGAHIPRGALLVGPPGTGKTLLARAVAGEANVPFFSMSASEFVEMFVGVGASRVRDLFNQARQAAPAVIFIDEIDAVGRKRTMRVTGNDERDQTLNQLLVELDGFDTRKAVVVLAATNRVDILDKALLRPGRFDRRITVSLPDRVGREAILKVHSRKTPLAVDVSLEQLARMTTGMTGADLANLINEAALTAARRNQESVTFACFEDALARVQLGALRPIVMNEKERRIIAVHEGGHALVAYHLPEADTVNRVTILPRGQSLGVTQFVSEEDRYNYSREALMARIAVGLGGRVAEELAFGTDKVTTGAENDLQVVTDLARRMVTRWGMSQQVGVVFADHQAEESFAFNMRRIDPDDLSPQSHALALDEHGRPLWNERRSIGKQAALAASAVSGPYKASSMMMGALVDSEVQRILNDGYTMAHHILSMHGSQLTLLADALMEHEQLDRVQFEELFREK